MNRSDLSSQSSHLLSEGSLTSYPSNYNYDDSVLYSTLKPHPTSAQVGARSPSPMSNKITTSVAPTSSTPIKQPPVDLCSESTKDKGTPTYSPTYFTNKKAPSAVTLSSKKSVHSNTSIKSVTSHGMQHQGKATSSQHTDHRGSRMGMSTQHTTLMALTEGCGIATEVGICYMHLPSSECTLAQISDLPTFTKTMLKIYLANPSKILMTTCPSESSTKLMQMIEKHFPQAQLLSFPRKNFNDKDGLAYIQKFGLSENAVSLLRALSAKYYCLAATSALFRYLQDRDGWGFFEHTLKFIYDTVEGAMMIDAITAKNLELVNNLTKPNSKDTLFGAMNYTTTPMGSRLLRTTILQPSTDITTINSRLNAVQELLKNESQFFSLKSSLKHLTDLDRIISTITKSPHPTASHEQNFQKQDTTVHAAESHINHLITLKNALNTIELVSQTMKSYLGDPLLCKIERHVSPEKLDDLRQLISETLNEDSGIEKTSLGIRNQRCYAIKSGVNGLLDVARQAYKETIEDIYDTVTEYCGSFGLKLKLQFDSERKFYLSLPSDKPMSNLPPIFINILKKKKCATFTSLELLQKNSRIEESLSEIYLMSDRTVIQLLECFRNDLHTLYKVSEAIALLDLLLSFATACTVNNKVRPEFTDTLAIKSGRHPILEAISTNETVPNDTFASLSSKFQLVTGPNMSGKSTYIKQVSLLTIMAQTGSFVPAEYASFKLVDQILSRLANDTDFSTSYFMAEMQEMSYVLQHVTSSSLVIIDELGRGASRMDALSIATAISEDLIVSKAQCFFATHLVQMARNLQSHPTVVNLQLSIETHLMSSTISFPYTVKDGLTEVKQYGILAAKYMGLSQRAIEYSIEISEKLETEGYPGINRGTAKLHKYQVLYWFADKLLQLAHASPTGSNLHEQLQSLRSQLASQIQ